MIIRFRSDNTVAAFRKITDYVSGKDDWFVCEVLRSKKTRSLNQNKYYWGVVIKILSQHTGYTPDETHQELARMFLSYESGSKRFVRSTTKLNTHDFEQYLEKCRQWSHNEMNAHIPLPNEVTEEMYVMLNNIFEREET
jgi:hypothetical protein